MVTPDVETKGRRRKKNRNHLQTLMLSLFRTTFGRKTKQDFTSHVIESVTSTNTHVYSDTASQSVSQPSNVPTTSNPTDSSFSKASGSIPRSSIDDNRIFNCLYTNADSLSNKVDELESKLYQSRHDICAVTEILPKSSSNVWIDQHYRINGYQIYSNLKNAPSRGVALYIKDGFTVKTIECENSLIESVFVEIRLKNDENVICGAIYRSPSINNYEAIRNLIRNICSKNSCCRILLFGDFNYPEIDWNNHFTCTDDSHPAYQFLETIDDCFLIQCIDKPTRHRVDQTSNTLDLILTDDQTSINKLKYGDPLGSSDHVTIEMEYIIKARLDHNQSSNSKRFALDRGDYQSMKNDLNRIDWDKEFEGMSTNSMMNFFESKLKQASEKFIPQFLADSNPGKERQPSWINHKTLRALKKKHNAYKRWMITKDGRDYQKYKQQ